MKKWLKFKFLLAPLLIMSLYLIHASLTLKKSETNPFKQLKAENLGIVRVAIAPEPLNETASIPEVKPEIQPEVKLIIKPDFLQLSLYQKSRLANQLSSSKPTDIPAAELQSILYDTLFEELYIKKTFIENQEQRDFIMSTMRKLESAYPVNSQKYSSLNLLYESFSGRGIVMASGNKHIK